MAETSLKRFGESSNQIEERSLQTQQNTKNNRRCVWNQFQQFCNERGYELTNETSTQQIATILTDWAVNMRRSNGEEYKEYSVKTIWNVTAKIIQEKYLKEYNRSFNPFFDQEFKRARDARKAKRKQLQAIPEKRKVSTKALKSEQYRAMIDSCDENTPVGLQFKFYLIASQELGWRGRDGSNCLVHYFREDVSNDGKSPRKIAYNPEFSRSLLRGVPYLLDTKWLVENEDISKCPVRLFKLLLQKRTERIKTDYLFLYPNPYYKKSGVWYKNLPLQSNELSKWTRKCAKKVQLNALDQRTVVYSVHSLAGGIPQEQALGPPQEEALGLPQDQVLTNITRPMSATSSKQMVQINQQCNSTVVSELSTAKLSPSVQLKMGSLACPLCCDNVFSSRSSLKHHLLEVENKIQCPDCSEKFRSILALANHLDGQCLKPTEIVEIKSEVLETKEFSEVYVDGQTEKKDDSNSHLQDVASSISSLNEESTSQMAIDPLHDLAVIKSEIDDSDSEDRLSFKTEMDIDIDRDNEFKLDEPSSHQHSRGDKGDWLERELEKLDSINDAETVTLDDAATDTQNPYFCSDCGVTFPNAEEHIRKSHSERPTPATEEMQPKRRRTWNPEDMRRAIETVRRKEMGLKRASAAFNVPRSTLNSKVKSREENMEKLIFSKLGRKTVLPEDVEEILATYSLFMEKNFFSVTYTDIKQMAFQLATKYNIPNPFPKSNKTAGADWIRGFLIRHPEIYSHKSNMRQITKTKGFTPEKVKYFFEIFEPLLEMINNSPNRLYNCDETGFSVYQHKEQPINALKGKRVTGAIVPTVINRRNHITVLTCMSASGHYVPPLLVYPREHMEQELLKGAPSGSIAICHKAGWVETESFCQWFRHFIKHVKPTKKDPVLLVTDGFYSHSTNVELLSTAVENGVYLLCLPPHCALKMHPIECSFMEPFKKYFGQEVKAWFRKHRGQNLTHFQVTSLLGKAYDRVDKISVAVNGFSASGLFPCKKNIFDSEFIKEPVNTMVDESLEIAPVVITTTPDIYDDNSSSAVNCETSAPSKSSSSLSLNSDRVVSDEESTNPQAPCRNQYSMRSLERRKAVMAKRLMRENGGCGEESEQEKNIKKKRKVVFNDSSDSEDEQEDFSSEIDSDWHENDS